MAIENYAQLKDVIKSAVQVAYAAAENKPVEEIRRDGRYEQAIFKGLNLSDKSKHETSDGLYAKAADYVVEGLLQDASVLPKAPREFQHGALDKQQAPTFLKVLNTEVNKSMQQGQVSGRIAQF